MILQRQVREVPGTVGGASDSVMMNLRRFLVFFRTPSTWTSIPGFQGDDFLGALDDEEFSVVEGSGVAGTPGV